MKIVCRLVLNVEKENKRKGCSSRFQNRRVRADFGGKPGSSSATPVTPAAAKGARSSKTVPNVGRSSRLEKDGATPKRYFKCQGIRHFAADCPNQQVGTLVEVASDPLFDESDEEQPEDTGSHGSEDMNIVYTDSEEYLVI